MLEPSYMKAKKEMPLPTVQELVDRMNRSRKAELISNETVLVTKLKNALQDSGNRQKLLSELISTPRGATYKSALTRLVLGMSDEELRLATKLNAEIGAEYLSFVLVE